MRPLTAGEQILVLDTQLLVASERLARYRAKRAETSVIVQLGVVNRQLDVRLELMRDRDS